VETVLPLSTASLGQHAERDSTEARAASAPAPGVAPTLGQDAPAPGPSTHGPSGRVGLAGAVVVEVPLVLRALAIYLVAAVAGLIALVRWQRVEV